MILFRIVYGTVIAALLVASSLAIGYNTGWDQGYIVGAFDITLGGVQLEQLCDKRGNCKVPERYSE